MNTVIDFRSASNEDAPAPLANIEAEQALLGAVLCDNAAHEGLGDKLHPQHFYEPFHQRLFGAASELIGKGRLAEPIVLMERFKDDPAFIDLGGLGYLADLVDRAPPTRNAPDYADVVFDLAIRRETVRIGKELAASAGQARDRTAFQVLDEAEQALYALSERGPAGGGFVDFGTALDGAMEMAAAAYDRKGAVAGLSTGLVDLDGMLGGLHPSDLIVLAGRPSMGKSALAMNIAYAVARDGDPVGFYSLEMSAEQLGLRILSEVSGVAGDRVRKGQIDASEFGRLRDARDEIRRAPLHIDATGGLLLGKLCARARRLHRKKGLKLIVVDYLQLVTASDDRRGQGRVQEVTEITMGLKALAKELSVPVLALSQLSRRVEERDDKRPMLSDLRESGSIEQDADVVAFVYREEYYLSRSEPREGTSEHMAWCDAMSQVQGLAEVIIGKQRHGPIGTVKLHFNPDLTKFGNLARESRFDPSTKAIDFSEPRGGRD